MKMVIGVTKMVAREIAKRRRARVIANIVATAAAAPVTDMRSPATYGIFFNGKVMNDDMRLSRSRNDSTSAHDRDLEEMEKKGEALTNCADR
jgi:hypothetical protein